MAPRIPIHLVTGFLGAGKTTFLNHLIRERLPERILVIENEVGAANIDGGLIYEGREELIELTAGCLCCSLNDELLGVLEDVSARRSEFDRVIIETTGVADPSSLVKTIVGHPGVERVFDFGKVLCVTDAVNIEDWLAETDEARRQLVAADVVLLNKACEVNPDYLQVLQKQIARLVPYAEIVTGDNGVFSTNELLLPRPIETNLTQRAGDEVSPAGFAHAINSFTLTFEEPFDFNLLTYELQRLVLLHHHQLYRVKGVVDVAGSPLRVVIQSVRESILIEEGDRWPVGESKTTTLVFIGHRIDRKIVEKIVRRGLAKNLKPQT